jgi:predicted nucleic-acid-binding Zn-ribbon protein
MIKCNKCGNENRFLEVHVGGERRHQWTQEENGRFVFDGSNYDRVEDTFFKCAKCFSDMSNQYRKFLQALFEPFDEKKHGPM